MLGVFFSMENNQNLIDGLVRYFKLGNYALTIEYLMNNDLKKKNLLIIVEKALEKIGTLLEEEMISITQVYLSSFIVQQVIDYYFPVSSYIEDSIGTIVLGTMADDNHSLGKDLVKRFCSAFFTVHDLGMNVSPDQFIIASNKHSADIIAVSAVMLNAIHNIEKLSKALNESRWTKKPILIVGGAPFNIDPDLWKRVGADAMVSNAFEAPRIFRDLLKGRR